MHGQKNIKRDQMELTNYEERVLTIAKVCLYSYLSYPTCKMHFSTQYYIAISGLSGSIIFFHNTL